MIKVREILKEKAQNKLKINKTKKKTYEKPIIQKELQICQNVICYFY